MHSRVNVEEVLRITQKWLSSTTNGIDSEDAKLVEQVNAALSTCLLLVSTSAFAPFQVSTLHTDIVKWMVQMLLRLAPDQKHHSAEAKEAVLLGSSTLGQLQSNAKLLFEQMTTFTKYVAKCVIMLSNAFIFERGSFL